MTYGRKLIERFSKAMGLIPATTPPAERPSPTHAPQPEVSGAPASADD
jgi:hypothetical protein